MIAASDKIAFLIHELAWLCIETQLLVRAPVLEAIEIIALSGDENGPRAGLPALVGPHQSEAGGEPSSISFVAQMSNSSSMTCSHSDISLQIRARAGPAGHVTQGAPKRDFSAFCSIYVTTLQP